MMRTAIRAHWARIRVLFTVMVSLSILFTLVYLLSGGGLFRKRVVLRTYFEDSGVMESDAEVDFNGVKIGKVSSVRLSHLSDPHKTVEVRMVVDRRFLSQIPSDSLSEIQSVNVLGTKFIEITRGKSPIPVAEGGVLEHVPATNVYVRIDMTTFAAELRDIDAALRDIQEGKGSLGQFFMTDRLYQDLLSALTDVQSSVDAAVNTKSPVGQLLYTPKLYDAVKQYAAHLDATLADIQAGRNGIGRFVREPEMYDNIRTQVASLRASVKKAGESKFVVSDEMYRDWARDLADLIRKIDEFNAGRGAGQMLANSQSYESLNGALKELESDLKDFREHPKKYLRMKVP